MKEPERKITVEDLLRLKRAERPPPEFWVKFESEIRAKQLAAIVVRRPWWDGAARVFSFAHRNRLPIGASAAIALTLAGVHFSGELSPAGNAAHPNAGSPGHVAPAGDRVVQIAARAVQAREDAGLAPREMAASREPVVAQITSRVAEAPPAAKPEPTLRTPFEDGATVALVDFRGTDPELTKRDVFGSYREFEASFASVRQPPAEPLTRMDPSNERLERLLVPALPSDSSSGAASSGGYRIRQKASYDRMYESLDRYGNSGMSLEFRF